MALKQKLDRGNLLSTIKELKKIKRPVYTNIPVAIQSIVGEVPSMDKKADRRAIIERRRALGLRNKQEYILSKEDLLLYERLVSLQEIDCTYDGATWGELFVHWFYVNRSKQQWTKCETFHINMFRYFSIPKKISVIQYFWLFIC